MSAPIVDSNAALAPPMADVVREMATAAKAASRSLAQASADTKNAVLRSAARRLEEQSSSIIAANAADLDRATAAGTADSLLDRLRLTDGRIHDVADGLRHVAALPDPIGDLVSGKTLPNGLRLRCVRVPLGVVGIVYEARPNVTVDAFGIALKSGNASLLRGSSSASESNAALVEIMRQALTDHDLPVEAVTLLPSHDRSSVTELIRARGLVDVVIPRGGAGLINTVVREATVPTIETGVGNCHIYIHSGADPCIAEDIVVNSKTRRPSVCNTVETVLIDRAAAPGLLERLVGALQAHGVVIHGDEPGMVPATEADWAEEYLTLDVAIKVVDDLDAAVAHIDTYGTGHTEAIITDDLTAAKQFTDRVDAAAVMVNAATAFTDGEQFGFGAEIGISTQKLHARGPMGLPELTSTKWVVWGNGQTRPV